MNTRPAPHSTAKRAMFPVSAAAAVSSATQSVWRIAISSPTRITSPAGTWYVAVSTVIEAVGTRTSTINSRSSFDAARTAGRIGRVIQKAFVPTAGSAWRTSGTSTTVKSCMAQKRSVYASHPV